jgi:DNA-binding transcriptional regulator YiaG
VTADSNKRFADDLRSIRWGKLEICQEVFAARYGVTLSMIRDQEQGRHKPHPAFKVLLAAIDLDPFLMAKAAQAAEERWPDDRPPVPAWMR